MTAGCSGSKGGTTDAGSGDGGIVLSGTVLNNHTDENDADRAIADASVILMKAEDAANSNSFSPIEDLATGDYSYPATTTGQDGFYQLTYI